MTKILAVTVTYNAASVFPAFLNCMREQSESDWKLIVIDNQSVDGTCDSLVDIADERIQVILNDQNVGFAAGSNQGIKMALEQGAELILLINNDTEFSATLFRDLAESLSGSVADAISPLITYFNEPNRIWYGGGRYIDWRGGISFHNNFRKHVDRAPKHKFFSEYAPGCCLMFKSSVFDQIGILDEQYFVYWEDADFCWRMREAGMKIILDPSLVLLHKVSISTGGSESDFSIRYLYRNHMIFLRKYRGIFFRYYVLLILAIKALVRLISGRTDRRRLGLQIAALREGLAMKIERNIGTGSGSIGQGTGQTGE